MKFYNLEEEKIVSELKKGILCVTICDDIGIVFNKVTIVQNVIKKNEII